jgi:hypothetical protein
MRILTALVACTLATLTLTGCPTDPDTEWVVRNDTDIVRYVEARGTSPQIEYMVEFEDALIDAFEPNDVACMRDCGSTPSYDGCDVALLFIEPSVVAVQPGESIDADVHKLYITDSDFYGTCRAEVPEGTTVFANLCHGTAALDSNGDFVSTPDRSGTVDGALEVFNPTCETFEGLMMETSDFHLDTPILVG